MVRSISLRHFTGRVVIWILNCGLEAFFKLDYYSIRVSVVSIRD